MREIKFRCWNVCASVMQSWEEMVILDKINLLAKQKSDYPVMQFTGAFDSHNVEMYVDDICAVEDLGNCRVGICPFYGVTFYAKGNIELSMFECILEGDSFKVIGNIHENKELLEGNE